MSTMMGHSVLSSTQLSKLAALLDAVVQTNGFYGGKLKHLTTAPSEWKLHQLPFTTRKEIEEDQLRHPPYGANLTYSLNFYCRMHQTSGSNGTPLRWLDTAESWAWWLRCWRAVFVGAGVGSADRLAFLFSFGPFIGFWSAFESAACMGNFCLPAGGMTTSARIRYLLENEVTVVCCTPTYALRVAETAAQERIDLLGSAVRALIVAGEPGGSIPSVRKRIEEAWGARVFDHAGMTEVGAWGFECAEAPGGMHINEDEFIAEVIDPATTTPVPDGEIGELVLTNLGRIGSPLIRYRTGDQVRLSRISCPCGRMLARVEGGLLGRTDDMLIIRGNNVFPSAIEAVVREFSEVAEFRIQIRNEGPMQALGLEIEPGSAVETTGLGERIVDAIRDRLHFRPVVTMVEPGSLPRFEMKAKRVLKLKAKS